jgi:hypothetical protein
MATTKKNDGQVTAVLIGCGVFSLGLLLVDIFAAKWALMGGWLIALAVLFHIGAAYSWVKIIQHWDNPNKDYWRGFVIGFAIAAIAVIMGHYAGWIENAQFLGQ